MKTFSLNGKWRLRQSGQKKSCPAPVPGTAQTVLRRAGKLPDPFHRDNEKNAQWAARKTWIYTREFTADADLLRRDRVLLRCHGLDTLATVKINGKVAGKADNFHRLWEFDVKSLLKSGRNRIEVRLDPVFPYIKKQEKRLGKLPHWGQPQGIGGFHFIRKPACHFGWDWGPALLPAGIPRDIELAAWDEARFRDVILLQIHKPGEARLLFHLELEKTRQTASRVEIRLSYNGETAARGTAAFSGRESAVVLAVKNPRLWWPNGMGEQPLYEAEAVLKNQEGRILDLWRKRIGLRELELTRKKDKWGESFHFTVNGRSFFAKGANWIPASVFMDDLTREDYSRLLTDAAFANMNMLRVWGGGYFENDVFYDLCDELGICIWQDHMFACSTYPAFDDAFLENVQKEADDNIRRLRHHACLALWCGNNELEMGLVKDEWTENSMSWRDYKRLFDDLLPRAVKKNDPGRGYWPGSPHTPLGDRGQGNHHESGDAHLWGVWHGRQPFEWYRTCPHRFCSEFGFQAFPHPRTIASFTLPEERNLTSYVMEYHQRSQPGNGYILATMLEWFRVPESNEMLFWLSQIQQAMAVKTGVEHWRRNMPRSMGALYWQLNDLWPAPTWASIDCFGRWKALHYLARRFFSPLLISLNEDPLKGKIQTFVTSDLRKTKKAACEWRLLTATGQVLRKGGKPVNLAPGKSRRLETLDFSSELKARGPRDLLFHACLTADGETVSENTVYFVRPKHLEIVNPRLSARCKKKGPAAFEVTLKARHPALWAWADIKDTDFRASDNFFHLYPDRPRTVTVSTADAMPISEFRLRLTLHSLFDTYQPRHR